MVVGSIRRTEILSCLNVAGNVVLVFVFQIVFFFTMIVILLRADSTVPVGQWANIYGPTITAVCVPVLFILLTWKRKRLVGEVPPKPGYGMSPYTKVGIIYFSIIIICGIIVVKQYFRSAYLPFI